MLYHDIGILTLNLDVDANASYSLIYLVVKNSFIKYKKPSTLKLTMGNLNNNGGMCKPAPSMNHLNFNQQMTFP